jgi:hypothetical protein
MAVKKFFSFFKAQSAEAMTTDTFQGDRNPMMEISKMKKMTKFW